MSKSAVTSYLKKLGSKGGSKKTEAQTAARKANAQKARDNRWPKKENQ